MSTLTPSAPGTPPEQADRAPWKPSDTLIGTLATLIPLLGVGVLNLLASNAVGSTPKLTREQDLATAVITLIISAILEGVFLIAPLIVANRRARGAQGQALGFRPFDVGIAIGLVLLMMAGAFVAGLIIDFILRTLHITVQTNVDVLEQQVKQAPYSTLATLIAAVVVAPICEEIFFRSFLLQGLRQVMATPIAILLSALIFATAHLSPGSFALLFILGIFLGALRVQTRSIWPGFALHTLNNAISAAFVLSLIIPALK